jgi:hypothetical protein
MDYTDSRTIIAKDALEAILKETEYGKKLLQRIRKKEFGIPVYVANTTMISVIHDNKDDEEFSKILGNLRKYVLTIMPIDRPANRTPLFQDIHISGAPWESARRWYVLAAIDKTLLKESLQKMDILSWCDIALVEVNKHIDQIITKDNPYYGIIKKLSKHDKQFPNFFIKN